MFDNIGKTLKTVAKINLLIGIIGSIIIGIILADIEEIWFISALFLIGGTIIESIFIYGFGELVENSALIIKGMGYTKEENITHINNDKTETTLINDKIKYILSNDKSYYRINKNGIIYDKIIIIPAEFNNLSVAEIGDYMFYNSPVETVSIPNSIKKIGTEAFASCRELKHIYFDGTKAEWKAIEKGIDWDKYSSEYTVHCNDD